MGIDVYVHYTDLFDLKSAISKIARVVYGEKEKGNEIYLNLSSHGRLISVASAIVGLYHNVRLYYVLADRYAKNKEEELQYGRSICDRKPKIIEIPSLKIFKLSEEERLALAFIFSKKLEGKEAVNLRNL